MTDPTVQDPTIQQATNTNTDINLDFSNITIPEAKKEPISFSDNRLNKEDEIVETKTENPVSSVENPVSSSMVEEAKTQETTPELPSTSLKEDQKIIDELTQINETKPAPIEIAKEPVSRVEVPVSNISAGFNLDDLVSAPAVMPIPGPTFQTVMPIPSTTNFPPISNTIPMTNAIPTTNSQPIMHRKGGSKKIISFFLFIILGGACAYVLKTMYPLEYENIKASILGLGRQETTISNDPGGLENMFTSTGELVITGGKLTFELSGGQATSGDSMPIGNGSLSGFDAFQELEEIMTGTSAGSAVAQAQIKTLQELSDEGKAFLDLGKKINDKIMIKYGLYVNKKANELVQSIENKEEIDMEKIEQYISQFSGYLYKLTTLSYDTSDTSQATMISEAATAQETGNDVIQDINREETNGSTGDTAGSGSSQETGSLSVQP